MPDVGGWFCYEKIHGKISSHKYHVMGDRVHKDSAEYYNRVKIARFPITTEEFDTLSLAQLEAKYPCPEDRK